MVLVKRRTEALTSPQFSVDDVETLISESHEPEWLANSRRSSWEVYQNLPMPSGKEEAWRRSDYSHIRWDEASQPIVANGPTLQTVPADKLEPLLGEGQRALMVFVDGKVVHLEIPDALKAQGVIFQDLHTAATEHSDLVQKYLMTKAVAPTDGKFAALHAALWSYGWFIHVPKRVVAEIPMHVVVYNTQAGVSMGHSLVVLEESSQATVIVDFASAPVETQSSFIGATELIVGDNANLRYVSLQDWNRQTFEFSHQRARIARDANLDWIIGEFGTQYKKAFIEVEIDGKGSTGRVSGFFFADKDQFFDLDTQQNHNAPATISDLLFKGAAKDEARTVWQGMIKSLPQMQKIDGFQASRNLLLSPYARMDGIPGLEIEADDVACSHAATFGSLEEQPIYYLMSRGIPRNQAQLMLIDGFFDELLQRIPFERVQDRLQAAVEAKILS
ncbi:MAG: Fe-S cluster assembly protein SufD [Phototrophicaceae bacterium]